MIKRKPLKKLWPDENLTDLKIDGFNFDITTGKVN
jgi:hypothetical protein